MTALRDFEDIIAAMDSNPQWVEAMRSRLLTRELLQLPERIEELTREMSRQSAESEAKSDDLKELIELAHQRLNRADARLARLDDLAEATNKRLDRLEEKTDDLSDLVKALNEQVKLNTEHLKRNTGHLDRMRGFEIERQMYRRIHGLMRHHHSLFRCRVLRAVSNDVAADRFAVDVNDARERDDIDDAEYDHIFDTDLISVGRRRGGGGQTYFVAESSYHLNDDDVLHTVASRVALSKVYPNTEVIAAVFGVSIGYDEERIAESRRVTIMQANAD